MASCPTALPSLLIPMDEVRKDAALSRGGAGKRKVVVTAYYEDEVLITSGTWRATGKARPAAVAKTDDTEISYFNQSAPQDRHRHKRATEIYTLLSGELTIDVAGERCHLEAGDSIVVFPGTAHLVRPGTAPFLCQVIAMNIAPGDKETFR